MTNEYQEALDVMLQLETSWCVDKVVIRKGSTYNVIREALQAGAEGRILPKLPERCNVRLYKDMDDDYWCIRIKVGDELVRELETGATPAEAMQNAIDKIGGE
jgi:hypothetical protein